MALTESTMQLALGAEAPEFALTDVVSGKIVQRDDFRGKSALLVMFICAHCPYVKHIEKQLAALGVDYAGKPVAIVAISSNDAANYPAEAPDGLKRQAETMGFRFPYLYDGDLDYERKYLRKFAQLPESTLVVARDGDAIVGASTALPMVNAGAEVAAPFRAAGLDPAQYYYFGESVLSSAYRGQGIGVAFFTHREVRARALGFRELKLDTLATMREARALYAALGFRECAAYYRNPLPGVAYMRLALG